MRNKISKIFKEQFQNTGVLKFQLQNSDKPINIDLLNNFLKTFGVKYVTFNETDGTIDVVCSIDQKEHIINFLNKFNLILIQSYFGE